MSIIADKITINTHSSIRIEGERVCYFDPYGIEEYKGDADFVFLTHDHYDHFDEASLKNVINPHTIFVVPNPLRDKLLDMNVPWGQLEAMLPDEKIEVDGLPVEAVSAYNTLKPFHPKFSRWLGYIVTLGGERIYVAGDTDITEEAKGVSCDIALLPCGGMYTMDAAQAAELANTIKPKIAIPTHYGTVAGKPEDGETFKSLVDKGIEVRILI